MMANLFSDTLFQLISSLEKSEKRHFKLYIKRSSAKEDLKIIRLFDALDKTPNVKAFKSDANMMLLRVPDPQKTFEGMKARGVLIKNVSQMHPLLAGCLRLTVGTAEENATMLAAIQASL